MAFAVSQPKWSACHETKSKHVDRLSSLKCDTWDWPWSWFWPLNFLYDIDLWPHAWPWARIFMVKFLNSCISEWEGRLILNKGVGSRSFITVTVTIWWPRSGVRINQIVTGVTSDVGVPSTHLVSLWWCAILKLRTSQEYYYIHRPRKGLAHLHKWELHGKHHGRNAISRLPNGEGCWKVA